MPLIDRAEATLVLVDFQTRLMPAIDDGPRLVANARRLVEAAKTLEVPVVMTEQNPAGLGSTVPDLADSGPAIAKMSFDACAEPAFMQALAPEGDVVICGCEAHVCVGQTVLSLRALGRRVFVAQDAIGSRADESKQAAIARMERHGVEIVTTEMIVFEWLRSAGHPQFRTLARLIK